MGSFSSKGRMYQTQGGISPRTREKMTEEFSSANASGASRDAFGENASEETAGNEGERPFCAPSHDNSPSNRNAYLWLMSSPIVVHATWKEQKERIPSSVQEREKHSTKKMIRCNDSKLLKSGQQCPTFNAAASNFSPSGKRGNFARKDDDDDICPSGMNVDGPRNDDNIDNAAAGVSSLTRRGFSCGFGVQQ